MGTTRFEDSRSFDSQIRKALLERHNGPPDNFVESAEGGAVDSLELAAKEAPGQEDLLLDYLKGELSKLDPRVLDDAGSLRYD